MRRQALRVFVNEPDALLRRQGDKPRGHLAQHRRDTGHRVWSSHCKELAELHLRQSAIRQVVSSQEGGKGAVREGRAITFPTRYQRTPQGCEGHLLRHFEESPVDALDPYDEVLD